MNRGCRILPTIGCKCKTGQGVVEKILQCPAPPAKQRVQNYPQIAHKLTSEQCIRELEQKAEEKKKSEKKEKKIKERERGSDKKRKCRRRQERRQKVKQ